MKLIITHAINFLSVLILTVLFACSQSQDQAGGTTTEPGIPIKTSDIEGLESLVQSLNQPTIHIYHKDQPFEPLATFKKSEVEKGSWSWDNPDLILDENHVIAIQSEDRGALLQNFEKVNFDSLSLEELQVFWVSTANKTDSISTVQSAFFDKNQPVQNDSVLLQTFLNQYQFQLKSNDSSWIYTAQKEGEEILMRPQDSTKTLDFDLKASQWNERD